MKNAYVDKGRLPSFLLSLCLHLGLVALVLFWPAPTIPLPSSSQPTVAGFITIGKKGRPVLTKKADTPGQQVPASQPKRNDAQPPKPEKVEQRKPPEVKPESRVVEKQKLPPDVTPIATKKEPSKNATSTRNATAKAPSRNATASSKPPKKDATGDALADLRRRTQGRGSGQGSGESLRGALSSLERSAGGGTDAEGDGPGGSGGDGVGVLGAYEDSVRSRVKPQWNWVERADRKQFEALVNLRISPAGEVQAVRIVQSSGNKMFDSSVVTAVWATRTLEEPPRPDLQELNIRFNSAELTQR